MSIIGSGGRPNLLEEWEKSRALKRNMREKTNENFLLKTSKLGGERITALQRGGKEGTEDYKEY